MFSVLESTSVRSLCVRFLTDRRAGTELDSAIQFRPVCAGRDCQYILETHSANQSSGAVCAQKRGSTMARFDSWLPEYALRAMFCFVVFLFLFHSPGSLFPGSIPTFNFKMPRSYKVQIPFVRIAAHFPFIHLTYSEDLHATYATLAFTK